MGFSAPVAKQTLGKDMRMKQPTWKKDRLATGSPRPYVYQGMPRTPSTTSTTPVTTTANQVEMLFSGAAVRN